MFFHEHPLVEVAGIEPASAGFSVGLLRAQSTGDCRERRCCRRRRRPVSDLVVPRAPSARARGKPYFMMPVIWSVGLGPGGHRCPRQRARAEARRLFVCSGSLTWLRRPRLASPTSTTNVETIHPRVVRFCTAPPCYRSGVRWTRRTRSCLQRRDTPWAVDPLSDRQPARSAPRRARAMSRSASRLARSWRRS